MTTRSPEVEPSSGTTERRDVAPRHGQPALGPLFALTPTQRDLYLDGVRRGNSSIYNLGFLVPLGAELSSRLWHEAVTAVVAQDPFLRVRFVDDDGELTQVGDPGIDVQHRFVDLKEASNSSATPEAFLEERRREPFDLFRGPMFRSFLIRDRSGDYLAGLVTSHLVFDEFSAKSFWHRISEAYSQIEAGQTPTPDTAPSFFQYLEASAPRFDSPSCLEHWTRCGREVVAPVFDTVPGAPAAAPNAVHHLTLDREEVLAAKRFCLRHRSPLPALLLSLFGSLIRRYTDHEGPLLLSSITGYRPLQLLSTLGCFYHVLPVLFPGGDAEEATPISGLAREMSLYRRNLGGHDLVSAMALGGILGDTGTRCFFNYRLASSPRLFGQARATRFLWDHPPDEIHLVITEHSGELEMELRCNPSSFREARFLERLRQFIHLSCRSDPPVGDFPLLLQDERTENSRREFPERSAAEPEVLAVELFERQVKRRPAATAVSFDGHSLSYRELDQHANRIAWRLRDLGAGPDQLVALALEPSLELVIGILGILKSGGAYVPFDPSLPDGRLRLLLEETAPVALVTRKATADRSADLFAGPDGSPTLSTVLVEDALEPLSAASGQDPFHGQRSEHAAYVIYTSGSTGRPKGVVVTQGNLARLFTATEPWFGFGAEDVWTLFHSVSFDFSVWELFGALLSGGRLVVVPANMRRSAPDFLNFLEREGVTVLNQTPSAFSALVQADEDRAPRANLNLRTVILGGEPVRLSALRPWVRSRGADHPRLINMYGITETTVHSTYRPLTREEIETDGGSPIGVPLPDLFIRLRDHRRRPVPPGFPGEIWVGGAGVARGYLRRDDLTSERFVVDPAGDGSLYRSGDRARLRPDGELEYMGRLDHQVKVRGFRIEPGEVEAALLEHPQVRDGAVVARQTDPENQVLVAYVVPKDDRRPDVSDLLDHLRKRLPEYMVPSRVAFLQALPLTANGKLDPRALPDLEESRPQLATEVVAPRTTTERQLARIWEELLLVDRVGIHDRFFDLGGHSLAAVRVISRIRETLGLQLPVCAVFQYPTVAELAAAAESGMESGAESAMTCTAPQPAIDLKPLSRDAALPCSFSQERVWLLLQMAPQSRAYEFLATLRFTGPMDIAILERTLSELVRRHEGFRTAISDQEGTPVQHVHPPWKVSLQLTDLRPIPEERRTDAAAEAVRAAAAPPFDLQLHPLVRWSLVRLADDDLLLVHNEHHLIHDGWSFIIVLREILELYRAYSRGESSPLPDPPVQFADFAAWQRQWIATVRDEQLAFWKQRLAGAPPLLPLPLDRPRPAIQTFRGDALRTDLPKALASDLKRFCHQHEVTLTMALLTAFFALLHRYTGETDLVVGSGVANRGLRESEGIVGMIINNVALRCDLSGDPSGGELARQVRQVILDSLEHQDVPFHMIVEAVNPPRIAGASPVFQTMLSSYDGEMPELDLPGTRVRLEEGLSNGSAKFDLNVIAILRQKEIVGSYCEEPTISLIWEFNTDLFDPETMQRMLQHYQRILGALVERPSRRISRLPLLTAEESGQTLTAHNHTAAEYPDDLSIDRLFRQQVGRTPDAVALAFEGRTTSYRELDQRASRLAGRLHGLGVGPEVPVGILMDRSPESVVASLAILKAGGAYVPMDPAYPLERLLFMLRDSRLAVVVTTRHFRDRLPGFQGQIISIDDRSSLDEPGVSLPHPVAAENLAYVMYTSGSTGRAKGVGVPHRAVVRLVRNQNYVRLDHSERLLHLAPNSFDAATFEIWGALVNGGSLVVAPPGPLSLEEIGELIRGEGVTTLWLTAPLFHQMVDQNLQGLRGVRQLLAGGDVLSPSHVRRALEGLPGCEVINGYGPTEGTTFTCCHRMTHPDEVDDPVSIGRPIANTRVYVLDAHFEPVPVGAPGELYIGGDGLARGYLGDPRLTARRFVPNSLPEEPGTRLYRSGDRVRQRPDGKLIFLGRFDTQVKIRGFRVEPGEIEARLNRSPEVASAVVVPHQDLAGLNQLTAYVVPCGASDPTDLRRRLLEFIRNRLPEFMVPSTIVFMDDFPQTPSGKLDRTALPDPGPVASCDLVVPRTPLEKAVARIWCEILGIDEVSVHGNFFDLGGHSLLATQITSRIFSRLGRELPLREFFTTPTIAQLCATMEKLGTGNSTGSRTPLAPQPRKGRRAPIRNE